MEAVKLRMLKGVGKFLSSEHVAIPSSCSYSLGSNYIIFVGLYTACSHNNHDKKLIYMIESRFQGK